MTEDDWTKAMVVGAVCGYVQRAGEMDDAELAKRVIEFTAQLRQGKAGPAQSLAGQRLSVPREDPKSPWGG